MDADRCFQWSWLSFCPQCNISAFVLILSRSYWKALFLSVLAHRRQPSSTPGLNGNLAFLNHWKHTLRLTVCVRAHFCYRICMAIFCLTASCMSIRARQRSAHSSENSRRIWSSDLFKRGFPTLHRRRLDSTNLCCVLLWCGVYT